MVNQLLVSLAKCICVCELITRYQGAVLSVLSGDKRLEHYSDNTEYSTYIQYIVSGYTNPCILISSVGLTFFYRKLTCF